MPATNNKPAPHGNSSTDHEPTATTNQEPTAPANQEPTATTNHEPTATTNQEPTAPANQDPTATPTRAAALRRSLARARSPRPGGSPRASNLPRRLRQVVLALLIAMVAICGSMVLAAARNDMIINHNTQVAVADVIHVSPLRTTISFIDESGRAHYPKDGVLYTGGLEEGQRVYVEYSPDNPDIVRVQGRTWTLSLLPAGSTLVASFAVAWLAGLAITRWEQRRWETDGTQPARKPRRS